MTVVFETSDAASNFNTIYSFGPGDTFEGRIGSVGDEDWVRTSLLANFGYFFTLAGDGSTTQLERRLIALIDADGDVLRLDDGPGTRVVAINTIAAGTVFIAAADENFATADTGGYRLTANREIAGTLGTRETLAIGRSVNSTIDYVGDTDWFKVQLEADFGYFFNFER